MLISWILPKSRRCTWSDVTCEVFPTSTLARKFSVGQMISTQIAMRFATTTAETRFCSVRVQASAFNIPPAELGKRASRSRTFRRRPPS